MGLLYLASELEKLGHSVTIVDLQAYGGNEVFPTYLTASKPDLIGISSTSPSHKAGIEIARLAKAILPDVLIVKGGVHETYCSVHTLTNVKEIDFSISGEADYSFPLLIQTLENRGDLSLVPGLTYRRASGDVLANPISKTRISLGGVPRLPRGLLGHNSYYDFRIFRGKATTQVQTMRGCPYKCSFCNQRNQVVNYAPIDYVVDELSNVQADGYQAVFFDDATFTVNQKRTFSLMKAIQDRNLSLEFAAQTRSECVNEPLIEEMSRAGFTYLSFGLETVDESALAGILKSNAPAEHTKTTINAVKFCKSHKIQSCLNLIVGLPFETDETLLKTFDFVKLADPTFISLSVLALYPHEDASTAQQYHDGVSLEEVWGNFDEGYGAVHPNMDAHRAEQVLSLARKELGARLDLV